MAISRHCVVQLTVSQCHSQCVPLLKTANKRGTWANVQGLKCQSSPPSVDYLCNNKAADPGHDAFKPLVTTSYFPGSCVSVSIPLQNGRHKGSIPFHPLPLPLITTPLVCAVTFRCRVSWILLRQTSGVKYKAKLALQSRNFAGTLQIVVSMYDKRHKTYSFADLSDAIEVMLHLYYWFVRASLAFWHIIVR